MTLRVILQIVPSGDETKVREIGRLDIFNQGQLEGFVEPVCAYGVIDLTPKQEGMFEHNIIHARNNGAWVLVANALNRLDIQ